MRKKRGDGVAENVLITIMKEFGKEIVRAGMEPGT